MHDDDITALDRQVAANNSGLAKASPKGMTKAQRKKAEKIKLELATVNTVGQLSAEQTFALVNAGLQKADNERSEAEQAAIAAQDEFTIEFILKALEANSALDANTDMLIADMERVQREALDNLNSIIRASTERQEGTRKALNMMSADATRMLAESFGSNDPNA